MLSRLAVPLVGLGMAVAGWDKLADNRAYLRLYHRWGWSHADMWRVGVAELAGGALMAPRGTRRIGGAVLAAASVPQLLQEVRRGDNLLWLARACVLGVALSAIIRR